MSYFLADKSYIALKPQADASTPILPTNHFQLAAENIRINPNIAADRRMSGLPWKAMDVGKGERNIEGDITVWGSPDILGHLFNMLYTKGVTTGDADNGYTHPFTPGDGDHYTLEIPRGDHAERYFGVRADALELSFEDGRMMAKLGIKAKGTFRAGSLAVALTGEGMTSAVLSTEYEANPNKGLAVGDVIIIGSTEITLTSVSEDGRTVGFEAKTVTASIGDTVFLKAQTPSFGTARDPFYRTNVLAGFGADESAATTAAGSETTATALNELVIEFRNNLLEAMQTGKRGAGALLNQTLEANIKIKRLFEDPEQYRDWLEAVGKAVTIIATGQPIKADQSTSQLLTMKFYLTKLIDNQEPLNVGGYVIAEQVLEALYDTGESKSVTVDLVNQTAGTAY